jgi:repressor LexA
LSHRQRETLEIIVAFIRGVLRYPTYEEIGEAMGIGSKQGVSDHMAALERKGYLSRRGSPASVQLTSKARDRYGLYFQEEEVKK